MVPLQHRRDVHRCGCSFSRLACLIANPKKLIYTVADPARGLLNAVAATGNIGRRMSL